MSMSKFASTADYWKARAEAAEAAIRAHDEECHRLCNDRDCGFKVYKRRCPECPKDWTLDYSPPPQGGESR